MKKIIVVIFFLCLNAQCFSLNFGFKEETNVIKFYDNPFIDGCTSENDSEFFFIQDFSFENFFCNFQPALSVSNEDVHFKFYEIKFSLIFDWFDINLGKYSNYWGKSIIKNDVYPYLPVNNIKSENLWNINLNFILSDFNISFGSFFDTKKIDLLKKPDWFNCFGKFSYTNSLISIEISNDLFVKENNFEMYKVNFEGEVLCLSNSSLYTDFSYQIKKQNEENTYSVFLGYACSFYGQSNGIFLDMETGFIDSNYCYSIMISPTIYDFFNFYIQFKHVLEEEMTIISNFSYSINKFDLYLEYETKNLIKENSKSRFTIGVQNVF